MQAKMICLIFVAVIVAMSETGWSLPQKTDSCPPTDLCLILDTSNSIRSSSLSRVFREMGDFAGKLNVGFDSGQVLVAAVTFGQNAENSFGFKRYTDSASLAVAIRSLNRVRRPFGTKTSRALDKCRELFDNLNRTNSERLIIVVTDGTSSEGGILTSAIRRVKDDKIKVIAIGLTIGDRRLTKLRMIREQLLQLALNERRNVFTSNLRDLRDILMVDVLTKVHDCDQCQLSLSPMYGNMLGGTPLTITIDQQCADKINATPMCVFDGKKMTKAVRDATSQTTYYCSTPAFDTDGRVTFEFRAFVDNAGTISQYDNFYLLAPYMSVDVSVLDITSLLIDRDIKLSWKDDFATQSTTGRNYSDIILHTLVTSDSGEYRWVAHSLRNGTQKNPESISNEGDIRRVVDGTQIIPGAFEVVITRDGLSATDSFTYSMWSGLYLISSQSLSSPGFPQELGSLCTVPDTNVSATVPACPITRFRADRFNSDFNEECVTDEAMYREHYYSYLHPGSEVCYVQYQDKDEEPSVVTQQCCYDKNGTLLADPRIARTSIGTPLYHDIATMAAYYRNTILPFLYCCKEGIPTGETDCDDYQSTLPVNSGAVGNIDNGPSKRSAESQLEISQPKDRIRRFFRLRVAITVRVGFFFGDPHIATLDGHDYTFNGKGEFTYIETIDGSFMSQCRFEQVVGADGTLVDGTVFTALVAQTSTSERVQMEVVRGSEIDICVSNCLIDLSAAKYQQFQGVGVTRNINGSISVTFTGGYYLEVVAQNGFLSLIKASLPDGEKGMTRGLMGNFNDNPDDDLIPRGESVSLPTDSTIERIHYDFGLSWIVNSSDDSMFYYKGNKTWSDFYDYGFVPVFSPTFDDPELERQAREMCGDVSACLFDVAATGRLDIGMSALSAEEEKKIVQELSVPIVCDPPCENGGVCVENDTCKCTDAFSGPTCSTPVFSECDRDVCQNGGTCRQHVLSYSCDCIPGFSGSFCEEDTCQLSLSPMYGNMLGGTPLTITIDQQCASLINGTPMCVFDGNKMTKAVRDATNQTTYYCSTPAFDTDGRVTFEFRAFVDSGGILSLDDKFYLMPPYISVDVTVLDITSLLIDSNIRLSWTDDFANHSTTGRNYSDIILHTLVTSDSGEYRWVAHSLRNGTQQNPESIYYESDIRRVVDGTQIIPGAFEVVITRDGLSATDSFTYSMWSGLYLISSQSLSSPGFRQELGSLCMLPDTDDSATVPACPISRFRADRFNSGFNEECVTDEAMYREHYYSYLHPGSEVCYVQYQDKDEDPNVVTQQCCYDKNGTLLADPRVARTSIGTPLYHNKATMAGYYRNTILPFLYCCKEGIPTGETDCSDYQSTLPVNSGAVGNIDNGPSKRSADSQLEISQPKDRIRRFFRLRVRVAISIRVGFFFGDPHIATLDGHDYTFNGKGEFTYIETIDGSFMSQCRFEQVVGADGTLVDGTVFTALVAQTSTSERVQMEVVRGSEIDVCVSNCLIDLAAAKYQQFRGVGVTRNINGSISVTFTGGYYFEVVAQNGFLSLIKASLPDGAKGMTRGLMGNYNGNPDDDFIPRGESVSLPTNSNIQKIHYDFGLSWIVNSSDDSMFYYKGNKTWSDFYDYGFVPVFSPTFDDPELERQAREMCGDVSACLFDVAATGRLDIGMSALSAEEEKKIVQELSVPIVCDPPCENGGVCVENDTCKCTDAFSGPTCSTPVFSACDKDVCQNGGTCRQHVLSYTCECIPGFSGSFCEEDTCQLSLSPMYGNMLGGTPLTITIDQQCASLINGTPMCVFDGNMMTKAVRDATNQTTYYCSTPAFDTDGRVTFEFRAFVDSGGTLSLDDKFYLMAPYMSVDVSVLDITSLLIDRDIRLSWNTNFATQSTTGRNYSDIILHTLVTSDSGEYRWVARSLRNGTEQNPESISYESDIKRVVDGAQIIPGAFEVVITRDGLSATDSFTYSMWSGLYLISSQSLSSPGFRQELGSLCTVPDTNISATVPACPITHFRADRFNSGFNEECVTDEGMYREHYYSYLHPGSEVCYVQYQDKDEDPNIVTQQCCYDKNGTLLADPRVARTSIGTPLYHNIATMAAYYRNTILPFLYCCKEGIPTGETDCDDYQSTLPVNSGAVGNIDNGPSKRSADRQLEISQPKDRIRRFFRLRVRVAINIRVGFFFGEPHIATLDGHDYTFNGKGEFTYIETIDGGFMSQCRFEQVVGADGTLVDGTVFTALVAQTSTSERIQMEVVRGSEIDVCVSNCLIDLSAVKYQQFRGVGVTRNINGSISVTFTGGYYFEVVAQNGFLSLIKASLPDGAKGMTRGLMGNYNGNPDDDLIPRGESVSLPTNSNIQNIHYDFGLSWIVNSSDDSMFYYKGNKTWSDFYDYGFVPVFSPTFDDPELERQAREMCGDVSACLFDVAATGRLDIGMSALSAEEEKKIVQELSVPIVCDLPCENGVCVENDTCKCTDAFSGPTCSTPVFSACDRDVCQNGGTCRQHVLSYICDCLPGFNGSYCEEDACQLSLSPMYGNMLGGTPLTITIDQQCASLINGTPTCVFDGNKMTKAVRDATSQTTYYCSTPAFDRDGRVTFEFRAFVANGGPLSLSDQIYLLAPYMSADVRVLDITSLLIDSNIRLSWTDDFATHSTTGRNYSDIILHTLVTSSSGEYRWVAHSLRNGTEQNPESISYESDIRRVVDSTQIIPGAFEVVITRDGLSDTHNFTYSMWSGLYLISSQSLSSPGFRQELGSLCTLPDTDDSATVSSCPISRFRANRFNSGFNEESVTDEAMYREHYYSYLHPGSEVCYVQYQDKDEDANAVTQQCCYDKDGTLLADPRVARTSIGTPLYHNIATMAAYYRNTILPFLYCCKEGIPTGETDCDDYQSTLPVNNGAVGSTGSGIGKRSADTQLEISEPKTRVRRFFFFFAFIFVGFFFGHPHVATLDGLDYTFNGKGEFTYIETIDGSFMSQCRFEQVVGADGNLVDGTVFTALVAQTSTSERVQMEVVRGSEIEVCVSKSPINLSVVKNQNFRGVGISQNVNGSISVTFTGGYYFEVVAQNGFLSLIMVSLPDGEKGMTRGLMGNYNDNPDDDLIPRGASVPLPKNSSIERIHYDFGLSWIVNSSDDSMFYYKGDKDWSDFYDFGFTPEFSPTFDDPELERQAREMCGDVSACLFDVAATGRLDIGMSALLAAEEQRIVQELAVPIVCDPPCENGVCVENDTCQCTDAFSGPTCSTPVYSTCDRNVCQNGGTCRQHVLSYECECPPGFTGMFCENTFCPSVDACLVIDTSDSINRENLNRMFQFLGEFGGKLNVGPSAEQVLVAAVTFGREAENPFGFHDNVDNTSLADALRNLNRVEASRGTRTSLGLNKCWELFNDTGRSGSDRLIIVITDGTSREGDPLTTAINDIANAKIRVIAIGLTEPGTPPRRLRQINEQLNQIALGQASNAFIRQFSQMNSLLRRLCQLVETCP